MKLKLHLIILLCGLALFPSFTACKTSPQVVAYRAEGVVINSVDSAMKAWADYVSSHSDVTQAQIDTVKKAYGKYYDAQQVAKAAWTAYYIEHGNAEAFSAHVKAANGVSESSASLISTVKGFLK